MTMIAEYYAKVGIDVDKTTYGKVDGQLSKIESRIESFKKRTSKSSNIKIGLSLDTKGVFC